MNVVGAASTSGENEDDPDHPWSPGTLQYYGRAELKTSDHRYPISDIRKCYQRTLIMLCTITKVTVLALKHHSVQV